MKKKRNIIIVVVLALILGVFLYGYSYLNDIKTVKISKKDKDLGIKSKKNDEKNKEVINIALFGGDGRNEKDVSRSDSIMILSIDKTHKKLKLSSIMRDTYVDIHGHGMTKLNHAYAYGGPELAIRTINENFNLNIRDYAFVNFDSFEKVVDTIGGVDIELNQSEVNEINKNVQGSSIGGTGMNHLNGKQALAYSRIRKIGNGDYERTERQRRVMQEIFDKGKNIGITKYPEVVDSVFPYVETSFSKMDIVKLGSYGLTNNIRTLEQNRFPKDEHSHGQFIGEVWYLVTDLEKTEKEIHNFIYEDINN
ncbi:LCP family protein [Anaerosalibacter massiliensis]|uniref:LCP family protein n=1 Tax=Anaerosalibacter massiliensis TaxID=1347392 RepID=A0A9X2MK72_9FIRM|nr:LCP family protein [Anaerosalibacter massiliensis]MCR2045038.1 LCP family protein [Anaerosalibacter massiliensis]